MSTNRLDGGIGLTRRDTLKLSGLALGGLALGNAVGCSKAHGTSSDSCDNTPSCPWSNGPETARYSYFDALPSFSPWDKDDENAFLGDGEMRITFLGSAVPPTRRAQAMMSIFVEVGPWIFHPDHPGDPTWGKATDSFIFDLGSGVCANYGAMNIGYGRMDKVLLCHLHGDHMSDLTHLYCFGISGDRKSPLYVWGPGPSGVESPKGSGKFYDDGTRAFCEHMRAAARWHSESFSFQSSAYPAYEVPTKAGWGVPDELVPVGDDPPTDGNAMIPIELDWSAYPPANNVAYDNPVTGVRITHYPVIHARRGSIGYKLEWNGLSMIYSSDTKPERLSVEQAIHGGRGVDVFIHEMAVPPQVWAMKLGGGSVLPPFDYPGVQDTKRVQDSSHTPPGAYGYLLSQIDPKPRLAVATHFPVADDTVSCAFESVKRHVPDIGALGEKLTFSFDLMVLKVTKDSIQQLRAVVPAFGFSPNLQLPAVQSTPRYADASGAGDPFAQIDLATAYEAGPDTYCETGF